METWGRGERWRGLQETLGEVRFREAPEFQSVQTREREREEPEMSGKKRKSKFPLRTEDEFGSNRDTITGMPAVQVTGQYKYVQQQQYPQRLQHSNQIHPYQQQSQHQRFSDPGVASGNLGSGEGYVRHMNMPMPLYSGGSGGSGTVISRSHLSDNSSMPNLPATGMQGTHL